RRLMPFSRRRWPDRRAGSVRQPLVWAPVTGWCPRSPASARRTRWTFWLGLLSRWTFCFRREVIGNVLTKALTQPALTGSFGPARAAETRVHVGPESLPALAFLLWQAGQGVPATDAGEVAVGQPVLHLLPGTNFGLRVAAVGRPAPPGEVLAEPGEGLPAPEG